jgi:DNA-binding transcriptional LysR family regulator
MDLRLVEIFCCVCEEKSFSKAAERLHLTQPTVSSHIRTLEQQTGAVLLNRLGREATPTRVGALLYQHGCRIMEAKRVLAEDLDRFLNRLEGQLPIGASTIPGEYLLAPLVGEFHSAHPRIKIQLHIRDTAEILERIRDGRIELGFVGARYDDMPDFQYQEFAGDRLVLVVPATGKWRGCTEVGIEQFCREPLVMREAGSGTRTIFERRLEQAGRRPRALNIVAEMGSTSAVKQAVLAGIGISVLSDLAVQSEVRAGLLKIVSLREIGLIERQFFSVAHARRSRSPLCEAFLAWLGRRSVAEQPNVLLEPACVP